MTAFPGNDAASTCRSVPEPGSAARATVARHADTDFIVHPTQFPLRCRRRARLPWRRERHADGDADVGLRFAVRDYLPAGSRVELEIPLRGTVQRFEGIVVMVRQTATGYELGVWLASPHDASRARLVERICRTECYLRDRGVAALDRA